MKLEGPSPTACSVARTIYNQTQVRADELEPIARIVDVFLIAAKVDHHENWPECARCVQAVEDDAHGQEREERICRELGIDWDTEDATTEGISKRITELRAEARRSADYEQERDKLRAEMVLLLEGQFKDPALLNVEVKTLRADLSKALAAREALFVECQRLAAKLQADCRTLEWARAEALAVVLSHEARIEKLETENAALSSCYRDNMAELQRERKVATDLVVENANLTQQLADMKRNCEIHHVSNRDAIDL